MTKEEVIKRLRFDLEIGAFKSAFNDNTYYFDIYNQPTKLNIFLELLALTGLKFDNIMNVEIVQGIVVDMDDKDFGYWGDSLNYVSTTPSFSKLLNEIPKYVYEYLDSKGVNYND